MVTNYDHAWPKSEMGNPKVSVCIQTYNHESFIAQAIESVLGQEVNFEFELIIGEDDSSDGTREIVRSYAGRFPDIIRLFLNDRQNVIHVGGKATGRWNFLNNLRHAKGEYVALLDGDDYWIDRRKLQKQVDFLDLHRRYVACCHDVELLYEGNTGPQRRPLRRPSGHSISLVDLLEGNVIPTCSVVYRRCAPEPLPDWLERTPTGDWPLHILNARRGDYYFMDEKLAVYRVHEGGYWSSNDRAFYARRKLDAYAIINVGLDYQYDDIIQRHMQRSRITIYVAECAAAFSRGQHPTGGRQPDYELMDDGDFDATMMIVQIAATAREMAAGDSVEHDQAVAFLDFVFAGMPESVQRRLSRRDLQAGYWTLDAYQAWQRRDAYAMLGGASRALIASPTYTAKILVHTLRARRRSP